MTDTTRRAFIAATTTIAAMASPALATAAPLHDPVLVRHIAAYQRACRIVDGWHAAVFDPAADAFQAALAAVPQDAEDREATLQQIRDDWMATGLSKRSDRLGGKCFDLYGEVYAYPARTLPDMILKFEAIQKHDGEGYPPEMILADLKRIEGRA
jgi:hypothetical protein